MTAVAKVRVSRSYPAPLWARRWDGAQTHRLNSSHWQTALGQSLNADLLTYLETLRNRCAYESDTNPTIDGMISTHQNDVVGFDGPTVQVQSDSAAYNDWLEAQWNDWYRSPMPNPTISGTQWLKLCVRGLWKNGEYVAQKITKKAATGPVSMRVKPIHPRRLNTPSGLAGDPNVVMGIRLDEDGTPTQYYIEQPERFGVNELSLGKADPIPPDDIIHEFLLREEDQIRGVPWMAPSLQTAADLKDYDLDVGDAARQAANSGVYWYTDHPESTYLEQSAQLEMERGTQSTGPPGWKPAMMNATQPSTQYPDYRCERQSDLGRPVGMPLMTVRLDASKHNYSSARFDGQGYYRMLRAIQYWLSGTPKSTGMLSGLVDDVDRESSLYYRSKRLAIPERPARVTYEWTWPVPPHVDPAKEGLGERIGLENGTIPFADACTARGTDEDRVIAKHLRTNEKLTAAGLPPLPPIGAYPKAPVDFSSIYGVEEEEESDGNQVNEKEEANA